MKLHKVLCFVDYHSYTRDIQLFAIRIIFIICIVDIIYIKTFVSLKSDWIGHIYFCRPDSHPISLQVDQQRDFGILWPNNYSLGSKITMWLVSEIESTFETRDLGLTSNTGSYRTNSQSYGWLWPSGIKIQSLTWGRVTIDTVRGLESH